MFNHRKVIAVDISDASLEVALVDVAGRRPRVVSAGRLELPEGLVVHGVASDPQAFGTLLKEAMKSAAPRLIRPGPAVFTLPDRYTFIRIISIPQGGSKLEMAKRVREDAEGFVPLPLTEIALDFFPVGKTDTTQDVAYVAAPRAVLENMQLIAAAAGLKLVGVDPEMLALGRLAFPPAPKTGFGVVDIGTRVTTIGLFDGRGLRRTASVPVGGDTCTNALISAEHMTREEAEAKKRSEGLGDGKKASLIGKLFAPLFTETERSAREFELACGVPVERYFLSGGASAMPGLVEACFAAWKKPVALIDSEMGDAPRGLPGGTFVLYAGVVGAARSVQESLLPRLHFSNFLRDKPIRMPLARPNGNAAPASNGGVPAAVKTKSTFSLRSLVHSKRELYLIAGFGLGLVLLFAFLVWKRSADDPVNGGTPAAVSESIPVTATLRVRFGGVLDGQHDIRGDMAVVEQEAEALVGDGPATSTVRFATREEAIRALERQVVSQTMDVWQRGLTARQILVPNPIQVDVEEAAPALTADGGANRNVVRVRIRLHGLVLDEPELITHLRDMLEAEGVVVPREARFGDWQFTVRGVDLENRSATLDLSAIAQS